LLIGSAAALVSLALFPTREGLYILDAADHFINQYGVALAGLVVVIVVGWLLRQLPAQRAHANETSAVPLGRWWLVVLGVVTPIVLGWMMYDSLRQEFADNYEGYTTGFLLLAGWGVAIAGIVFGLAMPLFRWRAVEAEPAFGVEEGSR
jgi:NSS family neurotransmitter:Na+ symporter